MEVDLALRAGRRIIPVLVGRAALPASLRQLHALQLESPKEAPSVAQRVRDALFEDTGSEGSAREYVAVLKGERSTMQRALLAWRYVAAAAVVLMVAGTAFAFRALSASEQQRIAAVQVSVDDQKRCYAIEAQRNKCTQMLADTVERAVAQGEEVQARVQGALKRAAETTDSLAAPGQRVLQEKIDRLNADTKMALEDERSSWTQQLRNLDAGCTAGDYGSCHALGVMYYRGDAIPEDRAKASQYFKSACDSGLFKRSCDYLAKIENEKPLLPTPAPSPGVLDAGPQKASPDTGASHADAVTLTPTVYIHVPRAEQVEAALRIAKLLREQSFYTADVQNVRDNPAIPDRVALVKYFHNIDLQHAKEIVRILGVQGVKAEWKFVPDYESLVPTGRMMVWFTKGDLLPR